MEVNRPDRAARRRHGKTDVVDAVAAAHAILSGRANGTAKTGDGPVEMLRMFRLARTSAVKSRTQAINQLKAVIVGAEPALRESLSDLSNAALIRCCANLPEAAPTDVATATCFTLGKKGHGAAVRVLAARKIIKDLTPVDVAGRALPQWCRPSSFSTTPKTRPVKEERRSAPCRPTLVMSCRARTRHTYDGTR